MGTNVVNLQERQVSKQYSQFYSQKCSNYDGSLDIVDRPVKRKVTKESFTKDYIKLLTNFNAKGGDQ